MAVRNALVANATAGAIIGAGTGSPDALLYTGFIVGSVNQPPVAAFTVSCTNLACTFDSSGSTDDVGIVSRNWTFGDGTTAGNVVAPAHTFAAGGTFSVALTVTDGGSLTNTKTTSVTVTAPPPVNQPPVARFTVACGASFLCTLDATSSSDDVGVVSYAWDLGKTPNQFVTGPVQTNVDYYHTGPRTVKLTVTDGGGLTNAITVTFTVTGSAFTLLCTNSGCSPTP